MLVNQMLPMLPIAPYHVPSGLKYRIKVLFRLAKDTRAIDSKQYLEIQTVIQEIGKMVGGWIKSVPQ